MHIGVGCDSSVQENTLRIYSKVSILNAHWGGVRRSFIVFFLCHLYLGLGVSILNAHWGGVQPPKRTKFYERTLTFQSSMHIGVGCDESKNWERPWKRACFNPQCTLGWGATGWPKINTAADKSVSILNAHWGGVRHCDGNIGEGLDVCFNPQCTLGWGATEGDS